MLNKGNAAKMGMIWNTIHVILYVPQAEQIMRFLFYPILNVYDVMCVYVCVYARACVCVCVLTCIHVRIYCVDLMYVYVCVMRKTTLTLLIP